MANATDFIVSLIKSGNSRRLLNLYFPRDDGPASGLLVSTLHAHEEVSKDFTYTVTVMSDDPHIQLKDVQCKMVCVELIREDQSKRYFNGYCFEFALIKVEHNYCEYKMVLKPWLAFFRLRHDYFLFQNKSIADQTREIFLDTGLASYDLRITETDQVRTFSCQYDETDYNYLHRRWEEMGWHYWYEHKMSGHMLILSSSSSSCDPVDGETIIPWHHAGGDNKKDKISNWQPVREVVSGKVGLSNFDFKTPTPQRVSETSGHQQGDIHKIEVYQYEGLYGYKDGGHGAKVAKRRMEQIDAPGKLFNADGDCRRVQPGRWFKLSTDHAGKAFDGDGNTEFLILRATHFADNNYLSNNGANTEYTNEFTCLRRAVPYRAPVGFNSENTKVPGIDTATVVGPAGEEIHTDKYGRIKVQFHWDREGKTDEKSSCWLRVMTPWADSNFGMIALPRIGTEVVIQYLQGNPDRPLVVGQLYNERHMPPWDLPANKTQTGILTRSSKGGSPANANAFRFEDKKGEEEVWLHAEKDQRIEVEHDESHWVGHDRSKTIDHDETVLVKHDRTETVDHDETITVHNNRTERVDHNEKISIGDNRDEDVGKNENVSIGINQTLTVGSNRTKTIGQNEADTIGANWTTDVAQNKTENIGMVYNQNVGMARIENVGLGYDLNVGAAMATVVGASQMIEVGVSQSTSVGKTISIDAGDQLTITVGKATFMMKKDGSILLNGKDIHVKASGTAKIEGKEVHNN